LFDAKLITIETLKPDLLEITVYSAPWCPDCREAKRFLDRRKLPYTDINIETAPGAADEVVKRTGQARHPAVCN
jgi:glutaredoxin